ncbi:MAG: hypothetical protein FJ405_06335 [Verrucomicrobia bacterium]|nr:hypothetical protein [Verrucomicrobiota bacterium]
MKWFCIWMFIGISAGASSIDDFISQARHKHGEFGERAARFLTDHMPEADRNSVSASFLTENLDLSLEARKQFAWASSVPEDIFFNDVLPYAVFDETRDPWRREFRERAAGIVRGSRTASEAVQALNRELFNLIKVHYNTGRKRPNQSAKESMELRMATCTGLSIILVNACRAVGIPARAVGTPLWTNKRGNHTWVEIWDGDWHFTGADEYDKNGLNRGWFTGDASKADAQEPRHAIYATSWKKEGLAFPMVWARGSTQVAAVNVTSRYAKPDVNPAQSSLSHLGVRLFDTQGGSRIEAEAQVVGLMGELLGQGQTKAGRADLNDMFKLELPVGTRGWVRLRHEKRWRELPFGPLPPGHSTLDARWNQMTPPSNTILAIEKWLRLPESERDRSSRPLSRSLTRAEGERVVQMFAASQLASIRTNRSDEIHQQSITVEGKTLRWMSKTFGTATNGGRSLWISMHGGGNAPAALNNRQWTNQLGLYQPAEGIYVAPRAPTDTWNLWHQGHVDVLFQRLIENYVAAGEVNPDKVYLMGYSAGGDGVWQLAPRMADRFAAAAMMAGHPNEASLLSLRNLPFALFMGANDSAYQRNKVAADRASQLEQLQKQDPEGYRHMARIYEGEGHWMNRKDAEALPWMMQFSRNAWPRRIVWNQDDVTHHRFYWLLLPESHKPKAGDKIVASVEGQQIQLEGDIPAGTSLRLSDALVDLDRSIVILVNGKKKFSGKVKRQAATVISSLSQRADPATAATALLSIPR